MSIPFKRIKVADSEPQPPQWRIPEMRPECGSSVEREGVVRAKGASPFQRRVDNAILNPVELARMSDVEDDAQGGGVVINFNCRIIRQKTPTQMPSSSSPITGSVKE